MAGLDIGGIDRQAQPIAADPTDETTFTVSLMPRPDRLSDPDAETTFRNLR